MALKFKWLMTCMMCLVASGMHAQTGPDYIPSKSLSENSKEVLRNLREQLSSEIEKLKLFDNRTVDALESQNDIIKSLIKADYFVDDDSLQLLINPVWQRILIANGISPDHKTWLIARTASTNAASFGEGTFMITTGLISRLRHEEELAFTLAHELAHYQLDHFKKNVDYMAKSKFSVKVGKGMQKVAEGEAKEKTFDELRSVVYETTRNSRKFEADADSLGMIFITRAGFDHKGGVAALTMMDPGSQHESIADDLIRTFNYSRFPFNETWLNPRINIYSKKPSTLLMFEYDSLMSHPEIQTRIARLNRYNFTTQQSIDRTGIHDLRFIEKMRIRSRFESVEGAFQNKKMDECMFAVLLALRDDPHNAYLIATTGKIFITLREALQNNQFKLYVEDYTIDYSEDLRTVNNFLHNLLVEDMGELAFQLFNQKSNFNPYKEEHYYLMWQASKLTKRPEVAKKVKDLYQTKVLNGEYLKLMKD